MVNMLFKDLRAFAPVFPSHVSVYDDNNTYLNNNHNNYWFDTRSGHILSFLLPLIQEGQLSVTGENICKKYWFTAYNNCTARQCCLIRQNLSSAL